LSISLLCFSKDRPLQLEAYLTSLFRTCPERLPVRILYACGKRFEPAYQRLRDFFPDVEFQRECDFRQQVRDFVEQAKTPYMMFGCDDVVFKGSWDPGHVLMTFKRLPNLLAFSLRLGKEITHCYPLNRDMRLPNFIETMPCLVWRWRQGELDWAYPWELDCTVYSRDFVGAMVRELDKRRLPLHRLNWGHPNRLEGLGANLVGRITNLDLMAAYPTARASVVTINRVQEIAPNRVYETDVSTEALLDEWNNGIILDTNRYLGRSYRSIHIGDAFFTRRPIVESRQAS
jgi:hypothetical protein